MDKEGRSAKHRRKYTEWIRRLYYVLLPIFIIWTIYSITINWGGDIFDIIDPILNGLVSIFIVTGILSLAIYGKYGLIKTKNVIKALIALSFVLTTLTVVIGYSLYRPVLLTLIKSNLSDSSFPLRPILIYSAFFLSYLTGLFLLLLQGFGLISLIVLLQKASFHDILKEVKDITKVSQEEESPLKKSYHIVLRWLFDIPRMIDTSRIKIEKDIIQDKFSWENFFNAFLLESILAIVLSIYISLNPLLLSERSLSELFALASSVSYFIPLLVIPLFIFRKFDVKIPGPTADFHLFKGIRSKLLGLILTLGTILLFLRLALQTFDLEMLIYSFLFYFLGFLMNTFFITFVYFNYFEEPLAEDLLDDMENE